MPVLSASAHSGALPKLNDFPNLVSSLFAERIEGTELPALPPKTTDRLISRVENVRYSARVNAWQRERVPKILQVMGGSSMERCYPPSLAVTKFIAWIVRGQLWTGLEQTHANIR